MLWEEIACKLLVNVYHAVSAVAEVSEEGVVMAVSLFDTESGVLPELCASNADEIWFFSNHPEGCEELYKKDLENISILLTRYPWAKLRVLLTNEDFICKECALFPQEKM